MFQVTPFWVSSNEAVFPAEIVEQANQDVVQMRQLFKESGSRHIASVAIDAVASTQEVPVIS